MNTDTNIQIIRAGVLDYTAKNDTYISNAEQAARTLVGDEAFVALGEYRKSLPKRADDEDGFTTGMATFKAEMQRLAEEAAR